MGNLEEKRAVKPTPLAISAENVAFNEVHADDGLCQQIGENWPARWHVVSVYTGEENTAAAHLIARRFGIYQPTVERATSRLKWRELMFPGYIFVWVFRLEEQCRRILSCPGVLNILPHPNNAASVPDVLIDYLQAREWGLDLALAATKRRRRRRTKPGEMLEVELPDIVAIHTYSALHGIESLDGPERTSLLLKALNLA